MKLSLIVAMTEDRVIGKDNKLPWHISEDLKRFKKITMGHPIIMGRKTFESIGRPLPGRKNIVLTKDATFKKEGVEVVHSLDEALSLCDGEEEAFIIGGASIYAQSLGRVSRIYLTLIHHPFEGDARLPDFDLEKNFKITQKETSQTDGPNGFSYTFLTADRR